MHALTGRLWQQQDRHPGDRLRLFQTVMEYTGDVPVLYPGSFVDVAPSFSYESCIYVDNNRQARRFFADTSGVDQIIAEHRISLGRAGWRFIDADYRSDLAVPDRSAGLLVSLYAGVVSEHCTRYLRPEGWLLVNPSHGDVALASIDQRYRLVAVVTHRSGTYAVSESNLDSYLIPKKPVELSAAVIHARGRGIAYTSSPFAYLFQRSPKPPG